MENNILSPEEWFEQEGITGEWNSVSSPSLNILMERYSNYRTKMLQAKVLGFRTKLGEICHNLGENWGAYIATDYLNQFDEYFNITAIR